MGYVAVKTRIHSDAVIRSNALPEPLRHFGTLPTARPDTQVLVLGSFPSEASLALGQYYGHPRNQFWPLMSRILNEPLTSLSYPQRIECLLAHRVGLWDVLAACERVGSLDSAISAVVPNDPEVLRAIAPGLQRIVLNGGFAGRHAKSWQRPNWQLLPVPSSSPANARLNFEVKLSVWQTAILPGLS
jgi:hypoxanthine-DNA glycosylase